MLAGKIVDFESEEESDFYYLYLTMLHECYIMAGEFNKDAEIESILQFLKIERPVIAAGRGLHSDTSWLRQRLSAESQDKWRLKRGRRTDRIVDLIKSEWEMQ